MAFRFRNKDVKMLAAEEDFDLNGHKLRAGAFIIPNADRAASGAADPGTGALRRGPWPPRPPVKTHELTMPRIGYVHSWSRTQDEGWVRAALDNYGVPYTYFADQKLREGNLRAKYDVIIFPHVGGTSQSMVTGIAKTGNVPIPYKKTDADAQPGRRRSRPTTSAAAWASKGLQELGKFVEEGGTLITEGSTAALMAEYDLAGGVTVEHPAQLFARGSILRGVFTDLKSPIAYGYDGKDLPVYFNQDPVLNAAAPAAASADSAAAAVADAAAAAATAARART